MLWYQNCIGIPNKKSNSFAEFDFFKYINYTECRKDWKRTFSVYSDYLVSVST